jgi:nitrate/nitrite transport system substrate-binding protein
MPYPTQSMGTWILSQMKRWGYVKGDVDFKALSDEIFLSVSAQSQMEEMAEDNKNIKWSDIPEKKYPIYDVYGKKFNPEKINEYIDSFAIKRT